MDSIGADEHFLSAQRAAFVAPLAPNEVNPDYDWLVDLFYDQAASRHADIAARWLQAKGRGYYTISSAGHEGNALVAAALRPTDPALLHYRSGAFFMARARQAGMGRTAALRALLLGVAASVEDPISGGRHKVIGHAGLQIIPQTSTISSHLPRALGVAMAIERARKLGLPSPWPSDAVVVCSFGDASVNHSTAVGAMNAAAHAVYQGLPLPVLWVCEDNGIGISVRTPRGWVRRRHEGSREVRYFDVDGCDAGRAWPQLQEAVDYVRRRRRPAFLRLRTVRLMAHAGSDVETAYRQPHEIARDLADDPLLDTAMLLRSRLGWSSSDVEARYEEVRAMALTAAAEVADHETLGATAAVTWPLALPAPGVTTPAVRPLPEPGTSVQAGQNLAQSINTGLSQVLTRHPGALVFGQDVAAKGGVYGITRGLRNTFGPARVFDTLLDEQTILGLALGLGVAGMLPIPEIQYLAYLHNAEDQIRGEAASLRFFSAGQYRNPMVVRIAGLAYQQGFGGHFHNDNSIAVLRDIPGIAVAVPSHPSDAGPLLHACVRMAADNGVPCVYLEPIALYHQRDLFEPGDGWWSSGASWAGPPQEFGRAAVYGDGRDLTLVTFGNGVPMCLRAAARLQREDGIQVRVLDLRWVHPLPEGDLVHHAGATGRVLVVDETRRAGSVAEGVMAALLDAGFRGSMQRVTSCDSFVPLGPATRYVLLSEEDVMDAARKQLDR